MIISNFRRSVLGNRVKVSADIVWEDYKPGKQTIYFECDEKYGDVLNCNPDAFLMASVIPAAYFGESRVLVEGTVSSQLFESLPIAIEKMYAWYVGFCKRPPTIEATEVTTTLESIDELNHRVPGMLFTAGLDSFHTLKMNHDSFDPNSINYVREGIMVYGFQTDDHDAYNRLYANAQLASQMADMNMTSLSTNIYLEYRKEDEIRNHAFWTYWFQGAAYAATGLILKNRINALYVSGTMDSKHLGPFGSHPELDALYRTEYLDIIHAGLAYSRLEKLGEIADWAPVKKYLQVCNNFRHLKKDSLNCGLCCKCMLINLGYMALEKERPKSIPQAAILLNTLKNCIAGRKIKDNYEISYRNSLVNRFTELIEPLESAKQGQLAHHIKRMIDGQKELLP